EPAACDWSGGTITGGVRSAPVSRHRQGHRCAAPASGPPHAPTQAARGVYPETTPLSTTQRRYTKKTANPKAGGFWHARDWLRSVSAVVRRFLGDLHIMYVGLTYTRSCNFHELSLGVQFLDGFATAVAHGSTDAANQLVNNGNNTALVRHTAFNTFWNQFVSVVRRILEVAVSRTIDHGAQATHTAVGLVRTALEQHNFTRRLFSTGKHTAHHASGSASGQSLGHVAGAPDTAVTDQKHACTFQCLGNVSDRCNLR